MLRRTRYDLAVDVQGLIKSALLARASGAARVIGFGRGHTREGPAAWLYKEGVNPDPVRHVVDRNLALARAVGAAAAGRGCGCPA
jgi:heptosyltransferase-1